MRFLLYFCFCFLIATSGHGVASVDNAQLGANVLNAVDYDGNAGPGFFISSDPLRRASARMIEVLGLPNTHESTMAAHAPASNHDKDSLETINTEYIQIKSTGLAFSTTAVKSYSGPTPESKKSNLTFSQAVSHVSQQHSKEAKNVAIRY